MCPKLRRPWKEWAVCKWSKQLKFFKKRGFDSQCFKYGLRKLSGNVQMKKKQWDRFKMLIKRRKQTVSEIAINQLTFTSHVTVKQFMTIAANKLLTIIYKWNNPITGVRNTRKRVKPPFLEKPKELEELQLKNNIISISINILPISCSVLCSFRST